MGRPVVIEYSASKIVCIDASSIIGAIPVVCVVTHDLPGQLLQANIFVFEVVCSDMRAWHRHILKNKKVSRQSRDIKRKSIDTADTLAVPHCAGLELEIIVSA